VAVLTSSDRDEDVARSSGLGGNHFLTKPQNPIELEQRLRSLLKNLSELSSIRRGTEGIRPTAESAIDPGSETARRVLMWAMLLAVLGALVAYAIQAGILHY
jgi:DNA-binding response OmpR family regulator